MLYFFVLYTNCKKDRFDISPRIQKVDGFTHMKKTSHIFSHQRAGWYVCARDHFAYLSSLTKVSVPVKSIIP